MLLASVTGGGDCLTLSLLMTSLSASCDGGRTAGEQAPDADGDRRDLWAYDEERGSDGRLLVLLLLRGSAGRLAPD
jgi:hypothetical protein